LYFGAVLKKVRRKGDPSGARRLCDKPLCLPRAQTFRPRAPRGTTNSFKKNKNVRAAGSFSAEDFSDAAPGLTGEVERISERSIDSSA